MLEEKFGRPEIKENAAAINEAELSQEERDKLIETAEGRLRFLMDRAHSTATLARHNRFISKSDYERLLKFFKKIEEEIAGADMESADINETLARLDNIASRLKLPGDITEENGKMLLKKMEELSAKDGFLSDGEKGAEKEISPENGGKPKTENGGMRDKTRAFRKGGFLRSKTIPQREERKQN